MYKFVSIDFWNTLVQSHSSNRDVLWDHVSDYLGMDKEEYFAIHSVLKQQWDTHPQSSVNMHTLRYWKQIMDIANAQELMINRKASAKMLDGMTNKALTNYKYIIAPNAKEVIENLHKDKVGIIIASNCGRKSALNHIMRSRSNYGIFEALFKIFASQQLTSNTNGLVLSSELGVAKPELSFFDEVIATGYDLCPQNTHFILEKDWLHIGDHPDYDYMGARVTGGSSFLITDFENDWINKIPELLWKENA